MHRAMLLVLAALQSLPIRPHPQHPDPAATTHTSATTQLPPGYHRCSACLLLSLRLALRFNQLCLNHQQLEGVDQHLTRLHATLPGLLLGLSTAGVGPTSSSSSSSSRGWGSSKAQGSSQGQSGKGPSTGSPMDLASVNTYAHVAQALCAVLGRQKEGLIITQLVSMCQAEGPESWSGLQEGASFLASTAMGVMTREIHCLKYVWDILNAASAASGLGAVTSGHRTTPSNASSSPLLTIVLSVLPRCLVALQAGVASTRLCASIGTLSIPHAFPAYFKKYYTLLCDALQLMVELWPHWRCRPAVLRLLVRTAAVGAHGYSTMALLLDGALDYEAETRLLSGLKRTPELKARTPKLEAILCDTLEGVCTKWVLLFLPHCQSERALTGMHIRLNDCQQQGPCAESNPSKDKEGLDKPPSAQQLAPLALDLVWGMEGMLQMMQQHWRMFPPMPHVEESPKFGFCFVMLVLCGHVINALAEAAAVGPAGLAAQPASWLPCGNSLVEGWCSQLLARVCQLFYINSPDLERPLNNTRMTNCWGLAGSHMFLLRGRQQAHPSMSPEAERLLSCLTLVLTVALPLDTWLAGSPSLPADGAKVSENTSAIHDLLTRVEAEQVWSWQALAAGTPAEASLASVLQGAANKLQLPHLVAPAPQGWQPGRLTLDRGRGPPELIKLCFPLL
ncbi:hypothetical protein V8C86DRAFT_177610 [Haematococcus lacustris]